MAPRGYPAAFDPLGAGAQRAPRPWEPSPKVPAVGVRRRSQRLEIQLVNIAPTPFLVRLERADDWVLSRVEVLGGMSVRRVITTAHMPALGTYSKVNPTSMYLQAVLAPQGTWLHISHVLWGQVLIQGRVLHASHRTKLNFWHDPCREHRGARTRPRTMPGDCDKNPDRTDRIAISDVLEPYLSEAKHGFVSKQPLYKIDIIKVRDILSGIFVSGGAPCQILMRSYRMSDAYTRLPA
jgi:hypothetical protein